MEHSIASPRASVLERRDQDSATPEGPDAADAISATSRRI